MTFLKGNIVIHLKSGRIGVIVSIHNSFDLVEVEWSDYTTELVEMNLLEKVN